jgi:hypothetical protein
MAPAANPFIADFIGLPPYTSFVIQPGVSGVPRTFSVSGTAFAWITSSALFKLNPKIPNLQSGNTNYNNRQAS